MKKFFSLFAALLFAGSMMAADYVKVTAAPANWAGKYLVVYESSATKALVFNGKDEANGYAEATIADGKITSADLSGYEVTVATMEGGFSIKVGNKYISGTSGSNVINFGDDPALNTLEFSTDNVLVTSNTSVLRFNAANNNMRFRYFKSSSYSNQKAIQLYKLQEGGGDVVTYTVAGEPATVFGDLWNEKSTANEMEKQTDGTYKWEKTGLELSGGSIAFKVVKDHDWNAGANAWPAENYVLNLDGSGVYTITITFDPANDNAVNASATKTAELVIHPTVKLHGDFTGTGNWADTDEFVLDDSKDNASLTLTLAKGTYEFGVRFDGAWADNSAWIDRDNNLTYIAPGDDGENMHIEADIAGKYKFNYNFDSGLLLVEYPALYSCLDIYYLEADAEVNMNNLTVTYVDGKNVWVNDGFAGMLLYLDYNDASTTWQPGDVLDDVAGKVAIYKGLHEVKLTSAQQAAVSVNALCDECEAPQPLYVSEEIKADAEWLSKYVKLTDVIVDADAAFAEGTASNITIKHGEYSYTLRNYFMNAYSFKAGFKYDVTALVTTYNGLQLYFVDAKEYDPYEGEQDADLDIIVSAYQFDIYAGVATVDALDAAKGYEVALQLILPENATTLVAGEYPINNTGDKQTAIPGIWQRPSFVYQVIMDGEDYETKIWYLVSGKVTVGADQKITVEGKNSKGKNVKVVINHPDDPMHPMEAETNFNHNFKGYAVKPTAADGTAPDTILVGASDGAFMLYLQVVLPENAEDLVPGTYPINASGEPGTVMAGYMDPETYDMAESLAADISYGLPLYWWLVSGTITVDEGLNITVDAKNTLGASVKSLLRFNNPAYPYETDEDIDATFAGYMTQSAAEGALVVQASNGNYGLVMMVNLPENATELAAGVYPINNTGAKQTVWAGSYEQYPGYLMDWTGSEGSNPSRVWWFVSGTVTVAEDGTITIAAKNSFGFNVTATILPNPVADIYPGEAGVDIDITMKEYDFVPADGNKWMLQAESKHGDYVLVLEFNLAADAEGIVAGEYAINATGDAGTVSAGKYDEENGIVYSYLAETESEMIWWIVSGKVTVDAEKRVIVEAKNSLGRNVKVTIGEFPTGLWNINAAAKARKFMENATIFIQNDTNTFNINGQLVR